MATEDEDERQESAEQLTDELARKYDPERLLKIISRRAGKGERLEHSIRSRYEKRLGVDLSHVRVYTGEFAEEFNRQRNAYAVTIGSTGMILMGNSPEKSAGSASGQALLAHELTHVAQATKGMHRKATFQGGMPFAEEDEVEAEEHEGEVYEQERGGSNSGASSGMTSANAMAAAHAAVEALQHTMEKIKNRVLDMAGEAARNQIGRNGVQRRA